MYGQQDNKIGAVDEKVGNVAIKVAWRRDRSLQRSCYAVKEGGFLLDGGVCTELAVISSGETVPHTDRRVNVRSEHEL
jgi:predicted sugar kinase